MPLMTKRRWMVLALVVALALCGLRLNQQHAVRQQAAGDLPLQAELSRQLQGYRLRINELTWAYEPKPEIRPISDAESVIAVSRHDWGLFSDGQPAFIFAAWPDGFIVWSEDQLMGGPPYRGSHIDPKKVKALLSRFEKDGLFADERLNDVHLGTDSQFTSLFIKSGKRRVDMRSWHELEESSGRWVATDTGSRMLGGRPPLDVLRETPADYLFYRLVWSETRGRLADLMPAESKAVDGNLVMNAGKLSWEEPAATRAPRP